MHNPLRSEAEMFRLVVIIGVACALVIAVALITEPVVGAIVLAAEVGLAAGLIWRSSRGSLPHRAEVAAGDSDAHRVLVVANETVGGRALLEEVQNRTKNRPSEIFVVVPAMASSRLEYLAHDVDGAIAEAQQRLAGALGAMEAAGLSARGEVGDHHDPNQAIEDALRLFPADELIVSTHPPDRSKWLERGVVERARREVPLPVTHVVVDLKAEAEAEAERTPA
jgi:GABA permease